MPEIKINKKACNIHELFLNEEWNYNQIYENIWSIESKDGEPIPWLIKVFKEEKYAKLEYKSLIQYIDLSVPKVLGYNFSKDFSYLIISREPGIDLFEYTYKNGNLTEEQVKNIAIQLFTILKGIHSLNKIHKDIKPENIIYDSETEKICLIDFEQKITKNFCSPEQLKRKNVGPKTDIWSAGVTFYYLLVGEIPFSDIDAILNKEPKFPRYLSKECRNFLSLLLEKDYELRYDCDDALEDPFLFKV
jgi:serine/threonine protein kinase